MMSLRSWLFASLFGIVAGCDLIGLSGPTRRTLLVQHHPAECQGEGLLLCLLVKEVGDQDYSFMYGGIQDFVYEWAFVYTIEVEEHRVENPPADGSSVHTVLRQVVSKQRVPLATQFDIILTSGNGRVVEVAPDHYRYLRSADFTCPADASCTDLRAQIGAGARLGFRFEHPATPGAPLIVLRWDLCDTAHANQVFSCRD
jgi:hypothetical protein